MLIASLVNDAANRESDRTAIVDTDSGAELTFAELRTGTAAVANALLALGLSGGDRVAVLTENSITAVVTETGIITAGLVCVPLNMRLSGSELRWQLEHAEASALVVSSKLADRFEDIGWWSETARLLVWGPGQSTDARVVDLAARVDEAPATWQPAFMRADPSMPARLMYTSATTGKPKGVVCPQVHLHDNAVSTLANQLQDLRPDDCYYAATPLTHMANGFLWPTLARGARTAVSARFQPESFTEVVERFGVTHTLLAPTMIVMLLRHLRSRPEVVERLRHSTLRAIWYAGAPIAPGVATEAEQTLGPILNQQYGLTELFSAHPAMCCAALYAPEHAANVGSCGHPMIGAIVRIADGDEEVEVGNVGEIQVRGRQPVGGYWRDPAATDETFGSGWIRTGDVGWFDDRGYLHVSDRKKDMIISGGFNVYSAEVEACLALHPGVEHSAVVGVPDEVWGEVPWAVVVRREGTAPVDEEELIGFVRERLAHFKAPKRVLFWNELPVSGTGKILKREIRSQLGSSG
jgi:fatty-acyl-CoA synthase